MARPIVLIVDDNPGFARAVKDLLRADARLLVLPPVLGSERALGGIAAAQPGLVLRDLDMPGMNGIAHSWQLKRRATCQC